MEGIENYIYRIEELSTFITSREALVIYGVGEYGKRLVDYLISVGENKKIKGIVITDKNEKDKQYNGIEIREADVFFRENIKCSVIIATSLEYQKEIIKKLIEYNISYRCMTEYLYWEIGTMLDSKVLVPYQGVDFLVAGFVKCGTTSLHRVMMNIDQIYVSEKKESHFFSWEDYNKKKNQLIDLFFGNIRAGQIVGMVEPTFAEEAKKIYDFFGKEIKIVLLLRNPINATVSLFKMLNRDGNAGLKNSYKKNGRFYDDMFEEYFEKCINRGKYIYEYIHWIEQFWNYYPKEQIKIVFFEELIKEPEREINSILGFLGINTEYKCKEFPLTNEGNFVMADIHAYEVAWQLRELNKERRLLGKENVEKLYEYQRRFLEVKEKYDNAEKIYNFKLNERQKIMLKKYFNNSVRRLERALSKDLSEIWFPE